LRLIIHYVGDIHQPLHTTANVSTKYPKGDAGGNFEPILPATKGVSNLHSVWDSVSWAYTGYATLPFDAEAWKFNGDEVSKMAGQFPVDKKTLNDGNFLEWATEGYNNAVNRVYPGYDNQSTALPVSDAYQKQAEELCRESIMRGGQRLADLMV